MSDRGLVRYEEVDGVAVVTLADPGRRNVLSARLVDGLLAAVDRAEEQAGALVLTGEPPAFCAGAELDVLLAAGQGEFGPVEHVYEAFLRVTRCSLPTIAAVNGPAVGAGLNLALDCDVRIASHEAWFDSRFHQLGIHPGGGHTWMLDRLVGQQATVAMVILGERIAAPRALELGLVWEVVEPARLVNRALALGAAVAGQDHDLVSRVLHTVRTVPAIGARDEAVAIERREQRWSLGRPTSRRSLKAMAASLRARASQP